tara:strand:- start:66 stop:350 length:285 start_codon:yes stop_codon:yes gene_type:complete
MSDYSKVKIGVVDLGNGIYEAVSYRENVEVLLARVRGRPFDYVTDPRTFGGDAETEAAEFGDMWITWMDSQSLASLLNSGAITRGELERGIEEA